MFRRLVAGVALAGLTLASACSAEIELGGPLTAGNVTSGESPQDQPTGSETTFPSESVPMDVTANGGYLINRGDEAVTITSVTLVDPDNMTKLGAVLFPAPQPDEDGGRTYYPGYMLGYPAPDHGGRRWDEHTIAAGARIEPGELWVLAVGLRANAKKATVSRFRVEYTDTDDQRYEVLTAERISVVPDVDKYEGYQYEQER